MTSPQSVSKCCGAAVEVVTSREGTSFWVCGRCEKPCDAIPIETNDETRTESRAMTKRELELVAALRWALWWIAHQGVVPVSEPDDPTAPMAGRGGRMRARY